MDEYIKGLQSKSKLIKAMRTVLFIIANGLITNNVFIWKYGDYSFTLTPSIALHYGIDKYIACFIIFCILFMLFHYIEYRILPSLALDVKVLKLKENVKQTAIEKIDKKNVKKHSYNLLREIESIGKRKKINPEYEIYKELCTYPVLISMFLISANNILCYLGIVVVLYFTFIIVRFLKTGINLFKEPVEAKQ